MFTDNVRIVCLFCNIKMSTTTKTKNNPTA